MTSRIAQLTLDVHDARRVAAFWSAALGMRPELGDDGAGILFPPGDAPKWQQTIWLQPVSEEKRAKLRLHLDLRPLDGDLDAEIDRLVGLGAKRADVGQEGTEDFTVLADPEGNEFCVIHTDPR